MIDNLSVEGTPDSMEGKQECLSQSSLLFKSAAGIFFCSQLAAFTNPLCFLKHVIQ